MTSLDPQKVKLVATISLSHVAFNQFYENLTSPNVTRLVLL